LIERARGNPPRVEPIIAPRFAPAPVKELPTEVEAAAPKPSKETARRTEPVEPKLVRQKIPTSEAKRDRREEVATPEAEQLLVPPEMMPPAETAAFVRQIEAQDIPEAAPPNGASLKPARVQTEGRRPGSTALAAAARPTRVVAGGVQPSRVALRPTESNHEPPIVRVTIGRIEVRAEAPPTGPPRKAPARPGPKLTLDAYLKERKEGRR